MFRYLDFWGEKRARNQMGKRLMSTNRVFHLSSLHLSLLFKRAALAAKPVDPCAEYL